MPILCKERGSKQLADPLCGAVLVAMNEEGVIQGCIESLKNQTVQVFLVVVNDGSTDKTGEIASKYADFVVNLPLHEESWAGRPELARVFNAGFDVLKKKDSAYVLISGADGVYPSNYVEEVISRMRRERAVLASGVAEGESTHSLSPRGSGRVLNAAWFRSVGFKYPENYGFEVYLVYKALSQHLKVSVFSDLKFKLSRKTELSKKKSYFWGKGMKALNYWWLYAAGRSVLASAKRPANGLAMLEGYLSDVPTRYEDIKEFVHEFQKRMFVRRLHEIL